MQMKTTKRSFFVLAVLALVLCAVPSTSQAAVAVSITIAPPVLPVYVQPPCPVEGYLWVPGYWAWGPAGYYWVPGVWVAPPEVGLLWTPGYWGFLGGVYGWHAGYWGSHIGFYGGVNYGFGYPGFGFVGGYWSGGRFLYNTAVVNVNRTVIRNVYVDRTVINNTGVVNSRASFNGPGGVTARPTAQEEAAARERHIEPTAVQVSHQQRASENRALLASVNHGRPSVAAMRTVNEARVNQEPRAEHGAPPNREPNRSANVRPAPQEPRANREVARPSTAARPQERPANREPAARPAERPSATREPAARPAERPSAPREPAARPAERPAASHEQSRPATAEKREEKAPR